MRFLEGLDEDLKRSVLGQFRDLWTHASTAIEGNTLTLAETHFVLSEGLTVRGKPLKDHNEVVGHARAIDILYSLLGRELTEEDLFRLHEAVQTRAVVDFLRPNGAWKREPNGTWCIDRDGRRAYVEFALPDDVPVLMKEWLAALNAVDVTQDLDQLIESYARLHVGFVQIHPFWDGNGRLARLVSNLPLLKGGCPPLVVRNEHREEYIRALADSSLMVGRLSPETGVWPKGAEAYERFSRFCRQEYAESLAIIEEARQVQAERAGSRMGPGDFEGFME